MRSKRRREEHVMAFIQLSGIKGSFEWLPGIFIEKSVYLKRQSHQRLKMWSGEGSTFGVSFSLM